MMKQYLEIKNKTPDALLFFRLGDFYEMFFDDAKIASRELDLVLTGRDCGQEERAPMCGIPYHSAESYIARLVSRGYRVAICEQTEDPAKAKGIVRREIVRVITPGTIIEDSMLDEGRNNFLASVVVRDERAAACFVDASTGALYLTHLSGEDLSVKLQNELGRFVPREILLSSAAATLPGLAKFAEERLGSRITGIEPELEDAGRAGELVLRHFGRDDLSELQLTPGSAELLALGAALGYLYETRMTGLENIREIQFYADAQYMQLDLAARRNLELCETMRGMEKRGSLLWVLDHAKTAMGKRMLRGWILQPLLNVALITRRQNAVGELTDNSVLLREFQRALEGVTDIERLITRISGGTANARELKALEAATRKLPEIRQMLGCCQCAFLQEVFEELDELSDIGALIGRAINEDPPLPVREGGIIREGYSEEVDSLRLAMTDGKGFIARVEAREKERTGIKNLKVGYNRVFGYYIEVTNSYKNLVPEHYIRKQTLANCERYITEELKELEGRVLGAHDRLVALEYELFDEVRRQISAELPRIQQTAAAIARLDVVCSFADAAIRGGYCRPDIEMSDVLEIREGRHPVVERMTDGPFVPNDTLLDGGDHRCAIITGPNMAGKSTYMRQVALITIMAQMGSFVPAKSARIGIVDAVFTRVGASDDLAAGQSTFMVEMSEVSTIVKNATSKSLLILDEIGRGTSTFDGMSIARAVLEYCADKRKLGARTLFATHYHELTDLEQQMEGVRNYNVSVKKRGDDITFLRRIVPGGADDSFGIEVAKLAGIPDSIVSRAKQILKALESGQAPAPGSRQSARRVEEAPQVSMLGEKSGELVEILKELDVNTLTPIEAMTKLYELSAMAKKL